MGQKCVREHVGVRMTDFDKVSYIKSQGDWEKSENNREKSISDGILDK